MTINLDLFVAKYRQQTEIVSLAWHLKPLLSYCELFCENYTLIYLIKKIPCIVLRRPNKIRPVDADVCIDDLSKYGDF